MRKSITINAITAATFVITALFAATTNLSGQTNTFPSTGNVGIGTTTPSNPLVVTGGANAYSSVVQNPAAAGTSFGLIVDAGGNSSDYAVRIRQRQGGNELFAIRGDGAIGIGTTSPSAALSIVSSSLNGLGVGYQGSGSNRLIFAAEFNGTTAAESNVGFIGYGPTSAGGSARGIALGSYTGSEWKEIMRLHSGGNVGIGTTDPSTPLSMNGSWDNTGLTVGNGSASAGLVLYSNPTATYSSLRFANGTSGAFDQGFVFYNHNVNSMGFGTSRGTRMTIDSSDRVGIGTMNPSTKLEVDGAVTASNMGRFKGWNAGGESGQAAEIGLSSGVAYVYDYNRTTNTHGDIQLGDPLGGVYVKAGGNVGVGTPDPAGYKLNVNGNTNVQGNITASGSIAAKYQDVAEWVPSSEQLSTGTVVVLDSTKSNQVTSSSVSYDTRVAGVVSEQPGLALGEKSEGKVLVATTGRVRVKVDASKGPIHVGDLLVTSDIPGIAMKSEPVNLGGVQLHRPGTLIGKALEPLEKGKGSILVLLSLQ